MRISVVVVNYNGERHLAKLVAALQAQTLRDFELIFIDNASTDESVPLMERLCAEGEIALNLVANQSNAGFALACNQGFQIAQGHWVALLNNDAFPEPSWLEHLWAATQSEKPVASAVSGQRLGMVAAKMLFVHAPDRINSAGIAIDWAGIAWDWRGGELDVPAEDGPIEIFGPCGGAALYSREMLDEIGGFDDDFWLYLEDVDLAWRAQLAGWHCVLEPKARVYHIHSATFSDTFGSASPFKNYLLGRNKVWLIAKNYPTPWFFWFLPVIIGYDFMSVCYNTFQMRNFSALRGRIAGLRKLPYFLRKRRAIHRRRSSTTNWRGLIAPLAFPTDVLNRYAHL